ncbi:MAG: hypothetical protein MUC34_13950 [Anaerolineae bacterium]|jgi:hypothetical protein|nr:hypothetical protein [Anaerolineae bacterium]
MSSKSKKRSAQRSGGAAAAVPYQKAASKPVVPAKPVRGGLLTAAIVIMAIHGVLNTVALLLIRKSEYYNPPPWLWAAAFGVGIATIVAAIALWYWKRWGLYLYLAAAVASGIVGVITFPSFGIAFYNLIPVAILGWILNSQKKMQYLK